MKELSIFIDESGDFGVYNHHSPFYIITMVFHIQDISLTNAINQFLYHYLSINMKFILCHFIDARICTCYNYFIKKDFYK